MLNSMNDWRTAEAIEKIAKNMLTEEQVRERQEENKLLAAERLAEYSCKKKSKASFG